MQSIESLRHACPERAGFQITRKNGHPMHTFLHFFGSVKLLANGKVIQTEPHACILYPAEQPQFFHSPESLTHDWIHFSGDLADLASLGIFPNTVYYPTQPKRITQLTKELEVEFYGTLPQRERMLALKLEELWVTLRRAIDGALAEPVSDSLANRLHRLRTEMLLHPDEKWTIAALSKATCLSESRFYSVYRSYFGNSPIEDLITARMDAACNMLADTDAPISQIAKQLGYANATHFTRQFKSRFDLSPTAFRENKK